MKSYLIVGVLEIVMVAVWAMPYLPPDTSPDLDILLEWLKPNVDPKRPIPNIRVERDLELAEAGDQSVLYGLDTFFHPESDRKGGEPENTSSLMDRSITGKNLIVEECIIEASS